MTFADRLRQLRGGPGDDAGWACRSKRLARRFDSRTYEQGQREPYWGVVFKLADALGVSCETFRDCVPESAGSEPPTKPRARESKPGSPPPAPREEAPSQEIRLTPTC